MPHALLIAASIAMGAGVALQPPINAIMARTLGSPLLAATLSIAVSLALALGAWLLWGKGAADLAEMRALPWWVVIGGVVGVVFVVGSLAVAPVLGVALFFVCIVAGQLVGATVIDHVGAFGMPVQPLDGMKVLGLALVLVGAGLVQGSGT